MISAISRLGLGAVLPTKMFPIANRDKPLPFATPGDKSPNANISRSVIVPITPLLAAPELTAIPRKCKDKGNLVIAPFYVNI